MKNFKYLVLIVFVVSIISCKKEQDVCNEITTVNLKSNYAITRDLQNVDELVVSYNCHFDAVGNRICDSVISFGEFDKHEPRKEATCLFNEWYNNYAISNCDTLWITQVTYGISGSATYQNFCKITN